MCACVCTCAHVGVDVVCTSKAIITLYMRKEMTKQTSVTTFHCLYMELSANIMYGHSLNNKVCGEHISMDKKVK